MQTYDVTYTDHSQQIMSVRMSALSSPSFQDAHKFLIGLSIPVNRVTDISPSPQEIRHFPPNLHPPLPPRPAPAKAGPIVGGTLRWYLAIAMIIAGVALAFLPLASWGQVRDVGYDDYGKPIVSVATVSGTGNADVSIRSSTSRSSLSFIEGREEALLESTVGGPGYWAIYVGIALFVAANVYLMSRQRVAAAIGILILSAIGFTIALVSMSNIESTLNYPENWTFAEYSVKSGLILTLLLSFLLVIGSIFILFLEHRPQAAAPHPGHGPASVSNSIFPPHGSFTPASFPSRAAALLVDCFAIAIAMALVWMPIITLAVTSSDNSSTNNMRILVVVWVILSCMLTVLYFSILDSVRGGTIGKLAVNIRVVNDHGSNLTISQSLARNWIHFFIFAYPIYIPGIAILAIIAGANPSGNPWRKTLTDRMSGARVVYAGSGGHQGAR